MSRTRILALAIVSALLAACGGSEENATTSGSPATPAGAGNTPAVANVDQERLNNAALEPDQWLTFGGTYNEQRYSPLSQINRDNVDQLGLA